MKNRRIVVWLLGALFLAGAGTALWRFWPRDLLLLKNARRVSDADGFDGWVSDHEIMRFTSHDEHSDLVASRVDLDTGKIRSAPITDYPYTSHAQCAFSPDGNWALCWDTGDPEIPVAADSLWTHRSRRWSAEGDVYHYPLVWMGDSRRWLSTATLTEGYLSLYRLDGPDKPLHLPFPDFRSVVWQDFVVCGSDRLFAIDRGGDKTDFITNGVDLTEFRLGSRVERLRHVSIRLPIKGEMKEFKLSPAGDRIAWVFNEQRSPALSVWLHRLLHQVPVKSEPLFSLWTTDIEGRHLREVGHIPLDLPALADEMYLSVDWVPGGRKLSFVYKAALYTVPVE